MQFGIRGKIITLVRSSVMSHIKFLKTISHVFVFADIEEHL